MSSREIVVAYNPSALRKLCGVAVDTVVDATTAVAHVTLALSNVDAYVCVLRALATLVAADCDGLDANTLETSCGLVVEFPDDGTCVCRAQQRRTPGCRFSSRLWPCCGAACQFLAS